MDAKRLIFLLLAACLVPTAVSAAPAISSLVPQYPRSELVEFTETREVETHEVVMGAVKNTAGQVAPEKSEFVEGRRLASTWFIPNEERTAVVADFFRQHLSALGEIAFECTGFDCGSSNHWANRIFGRSILYGPARHQHYFLTRVETEEGPGWVATYVALRGTRKMYVHTDVIVETTAAEVGGAGIVRALLTEGRYVIGAGQEATASDDVVEAMQLEPLYRIAIVGHARKQRGETVEQAVARSRAVAVEFMAKVVKDGVNQTRVSAHGVGPLAPADLDLTERLEVVLISRD